MLISRSQLILLGIFVIIIKLLIIKAVLSLNNFSKIFLSSYLVFYNPNKLIIKKKIKFAILNSFQNYQ